MKKMLFLLSAGLLATGAVQAGLVALDLPASNSYSSATAVLTSQSYSGATFDLSYTIDSVANGASPFVYSTGTKVGVGGTYDLPGQYDTLEGDDGEGLSFTGLSIANFNAGASGLTIGDITNLRFTGLTIGNSGNTLDGVDISFTGFGAGVSNVDLGPLPTTSVLDLTVLGNYNASATGLYIEPDSIEGNNRWNVTGLQVAYTIPEPATLGIVASCGIAVLFIRRRFFG